jgi:hypothetical protein
MDRMPRMVALGSDCRYWERSVNMRQREGSGRVRYFDAIKINKSCSSCIQVVADMVGFQKAGGVVETTAGIAVVKACGLFLPRKQGQSREDSPVLRRPGAEKGGHACGWDGENIKGGMETLIVIII